MTNTNAISARPSEWGISNVPIVRGLIAGCRDTVTVVAAAREMSRMAIRTHAGHAELKHTVEGVFNKHGLLATTPCREDRIVLATEIDDEDSVGECLILARAELQAAKSHLAHQISNHHASQMLCDC